MSETTIVVSAGDIWFYGFLLGLVIGIAFGVWVGRGTVRGDA